MNVKTLVLLHSGKDGTSMWWCGGLCEAGGAAAAGWAAPFHYVFNYVLINPLILLWNAFVALIFNGGSSLNIYSFISQR